MSALTNLFTALANKIRSKIGGTQTYTPPQMVNAIDDVYNKGLVDGDTSTSITPSNTSPVSLTSGNKYKPNANGYAINSYSDVSQSGSGSTALSSNGIFRATSSGYFIASRNSGTISPSSSGTSFSSGWNYMNSSGYAYSSRPSGMSSVRLWDNSNTSTSFSDQTITLYGSMSSYNYIRISYNIKTSTGENIWVLIHRGDFQACTGDDAGRFAIGGNVNGNIRVRYCRYVSATQIAFSTSYIVSASSHGTSAAYLIPTAIDGINIS